MIPEDFMVRDPGMASEKKVVPSRNEFGERQTNRRFVRPPPQCSSNKRLVVALTAGALLLSACSKKSADPQSKETKIEASASEKKEGARGEESKGSTADNLKKRLGPKGHSAPIGPQLVVDPGKGISAIRFGATFETIERHMGAPCDLRTDVRCLYVRQAVDFTMKDGVLVRLKVHRRNRKVESPPKNGDLYYGTLFGIMLPTIEMGLHRHIVIEEYGVPQRKEQIKDGADGLVERHYYDGVILEYDRIENGNVILAGMEVYPSQTATGAPHRNKASAASKTDVGQSSGATTGSPKKVKKPYKHADVAR